MPPTFLRVVVMGTRGKSSFTEWLSSTLADQGYSVLSRQTGLVPVASYKNKYYVLLRDDENVEFDREAETKALFDYFNKEPIDVVIIENNAITKHHLAGFNAFINPQLIFILTLSPDHILDQGIDPKETAEIFLETIPPKTQVIFWTNHKREFAAMQKATKKYPSKNVVTLYSTLRFRDKELAKAAEPFLRVLMPKDKQLTAGFGKDKLLVSKEVSTDLGDGKTLVNLGSVNDLLHTQLFLDEVVESYPEPHYFLFNFRADRDDRSWQYIEYFLNHMPPKIMGIIIYSGSPIYTAKFVKKLFFNKFRTMPVLTCDGIEHFQEYIVPSLPKNSTITVMANTANDFGKYIIEYYGLFQESYPVLKKFRYFS